MLSVFLSSYLGEREMPWEHEPQASVSTAFSTAFLVLPNFHSCFYHSIEARYMFDIS